ncbi:SRPBCC family protein [Nocardia colli]
MEAENAELPAELKAEFDDSHGEQGGGVAMMPDSELDPAAVEVGSFFPQSPEAVWRALTDPDLLERWLLRPTGFVASVGTHFVFTVPPQLPSAARRRATPLGEIACEVLTARPGEQLTYTSVDLRADRPARWVVDWSIRPDGRGTRLLVTQTGFDISDRRQKMARNALERGWKTGLSRLREVLDHIET